MPTPAVTSPHPPPQFFTEVKGEARERAAAFKSGKRIPLYKAEKNRAMSVMCLIHREASPKAGRVKRNSSVFGDSPRIVLPV